MLKHNIWHIYHTKKYYNDKTNLHLYEFCLNSSQPAITCSKLTIETLEQGVKYVQS